jgi:hypothetical protein
MSRGKEEDSHELRPSIFSPSYPSVYYQTRLSSCTTIESLDGEGMLNGGVEESTEIQQGIVDLDVGSG